MILPQQNETWLHMVFDLRAGILRKIRVRLYVSTLFACAVTLMYESLNLQRITLTMAPFSLSAVALAIFFGFRNNSAYERYWEGRKLWGELVNGCRTLTRQIFMLVGPGAEPEQDAGRAFRKEMVHRLIAFPHALREHLRSQSGVASIAPFVSAEELERLRGERNLPLALLATLGDRLQWARRQGWVCDYHLALLEQGLAGLTSVLGGCERIHNTPFPFAYTVLIHRIAGAYCITLPFGILDTVGWMTPVVVLLISYAFFGLDALGDEIENPFGTDPSDLPLEAICRNIEIDLRQRLGETDLPEPLAPQGGILL